MKKNGLMAYLSLLTIFILFNVVAFVIPTEKTATFWTAYAFSVVTFAVQIPIWIVSLSKKYTLKSIFLGIPVVQIGLAYLIIQLIAFAIFMVFPTLPVWMSIVVCAIICAIFVLCVIGWRVGVGEINRVEEKIKIKRAFIQFLQIDIEMLVESEHDSETKVLLTKLAEEVRFSDPMSHEMLYELESEITARVKELKTSVDKKHLIGEIEALLIERNKKCKILK